MPQRAPDLWLPETAAARAASSRLPFWILAAMTAVALAASSTPSPLYVDYQQRWHFSSTVLTTVYATYAVGVIVSLLLAGGVSDRLGRRPVILASVAALILSMLVFLFATDIAMLYIARGIQGVATGVFTGAAGAALSELHPHRDARVAGLVNSTSQSIGIATGAVLAGALAQWAPLPLRIPYVVVALAAALLLAMMASALPESAAARQPSATRWGLLHPARLRVPAQTRPAFVIGSLGVIAAWSVGGLFLALGGSLAAELLDAKNHLVAGVVILCVQGVGGLAQFAFSSASNKTTAVTGCLALIVGVGIVAWSLACSNPALFLGGDVVTGVGFGLAFLSGTRRVTEAAPLDRRGEVLAAYYVVAYLALSVPVIAAGVVSPHLGLVHTFYIFAAVTGALAAITLIVTVAYRPAR